MQNYNLRYGISKKDIFNFTYEDFTLENYDPYPPIKASISV